eukprot:4709695-Pyramimonas_sp.AAC.1
MGRWRTGPGRKPAAKGVENLGQDALAMGRRATCRCRRPAAKRAMGLDPGQGRAGRRRPRGQWTLGGLRSDQCQ